MKLSDLIEKLSKTYKNNGDKNVRVYVEYHGSVVEATISYIGIKGNKIELAIESLEPDVFF
jgi:hypothetical protein